MSEKKKVGVVFGGQSTEHEISRVSAKFITDNIDRQKYDVAMFGITKDGKWLSYDGPTEKLEDGSWQKVAEEQSVDKEKSPAILLKNNIDIVFPVLHGCNGEDGTIQGFMELTGMPFVGTGVLGSALCMDKAYSRIVFLNEGIPQANYLVMSRKEIETKLDLFLDTIENVLRYPCFVKPSNAGSSVGVSKAHNRTELMAALELAQKFDRKILVEEFIDGREVECAVLGNDDAIASTVGEILPGNEFYDYDAKYVDASSVCVIPADLPEKTIEIIRKYALCAYKATDCAGFSRVDFFVDNYTGDIYINEINTIPGFTSISMYPKLWEASGIPSKELIDRIITFAFERHADNKRELIT